MIGRRKLLAYLAASTSLVALSPLSRSRAAQLEPEDLLHDDAEYIPDTAIRDVISKAQDFENNFSDDLYLVGKDAQLILKNLFNRLARLQKLVGYANFNLLGYNAAVKYAKNYSQVGRFTKNEIEFINYVFEFDASKYGFLGEKVSSSLDETVNKKDVVKIKGTGHYVFKGDAQKMYKLLCSELGDELVLTSGVRSVVKQLYLFINKAVKSEGNFSRAARSLAPPGHSYHGIGDFDIGKRGLGIENFTNTFSETDLYKKLCDLGYVSMRYTILNPYGVRYEPWHIKVINDV